LGTLLQRRLLPHLGLQQVPAGLHMVLLLLLLLLLLLQYLLPAHGALLLLPVVIRVLLCRGSSEHELHDLAGVLILC
jgi:hypothetical protein